MREVFGKARLSVMACAMLMGLPWPRTPIAGGAPMARYEIRAAVRLSEPQIEGTLAVDFTNATGGALEEVVLVLFPNRFSSPDRAINDFNRPLVYPDEEFDEGFMQVTEARDAAAPVPVLPLAHSAVPDGCLVRIPIAPLGPGKTRRLQVRFRTAVPRRFGSFGEFDRQLTLVGGWHPYVAPLDENGVWQIEKAPPLADFVVELDAAPDIDLLLNGRHIPRGRRAERLVVSAVHYLALVASPDLVREETAAGDTRILFFHRPARRARRLSDGPAPTRAVLSALAEIVSLRPPAVGAPPGELVVVEAPMRMRLSAQGEGAVVVSDRMLKVHRLLRPFHALQLAQAVYSEIMRSSLAGREPADDYWWVSEGLSRDLAGRFVASARPGTRSVQDWIDSLNVFAIVDRFESNPKIPFVEAFFDKAPVADEFGAEIATFNSALPPGRLVFGKLRELLGPGEFAAGIDRCAASPEPFRRCLSAAQDLGSAIDQWLQPYPAINYSLEDIALNRAGPDAFRHQMTIRRDSSRPVVEPVTVRLRARGGHDVDVRWHGEGEQARLTAETTHRVWQAVIDPEKKLLEGRRDDNARPPSPQVVLDTAEVEISSTEFGISGLVVGRRRYDYRKDAAVAGFYTNRGIGFTAGARWHGGARVDPTVFRHNVYAFYGLQALDAGFADKRFPEARTPGRLASLGFRYDYTNVFAFDNPTNARQVRVYADWHDRGLGGDYSYLDWGISGTATHPLWTHRTIGAVQLLTGFTLPLDGRAVPNQGRYSLGGSRSIRGIGAEEELGRHIAMVRTELRQMLYPEVDLNFLDLAVLRRGQVRLFAETGRVNDSAGRVYDIGRYAVGVGAGLAAIYEFMGFFPAVAYVEVATRIDDASQIGEVQFLFGTRQAF